MRIPLDLPGARRRSQSAQAFSTASPRDHSERASLITTLLILGFIAWTVATRVGIAQGTRPTAWLTHPFGTWPTTLTRVEGSANTELSLFASFVGGDTVGLTAIGSSPDAGDGGAINGSRFVTGPSAGNVASMSVHVRGPLDEPSHRQFQLAIYADRYGAPGALVAQSAVGSLTADTWNTVPIVTTLEPATAYWLMYNTNGSRPEFNNATVSLAAGRSFDGLIDTVRTPRALRVAHVVRAIGHPAASGCLIALAAWWASRRDRRAARRLVVAAAIGLALEGALKLTLFAPYSAYPSGHVLRLSLLAVAVSRLLPATPIRVAAWASVVAVALASLLGKDHFIDEIVGGGLAGAALATMAFPPTRRVAQAPEGVTEHVWTPARDRRAVRRPGPDRRRADRLPPSRELAPLGATRQSR